jgi:hypothetical protein
MMIDITIDNNRVFVEGKEYHSFNEREQLSQMLQDVIEKAKYSGETISLWVLLHDGKHFIKEWH